ncbi:MAG: hypothetical protein ABEJ74_03115 [Haloferacaceae archaeon]
MTSRLPVECPLCNRELVDERLRSHLSQSHSKAELVRAVASAYEADEGGDSE